MSIQQLNRKIQIDPTKYANIETGELLSEEKQNIRSVNIPDPNLVIIHSDEYVIIDSEALRYIQTICSKPDLEKIQRMANMVKGCYNLLHDKQEIPHNPASLQNELNYDESEFSRFMKRLLNKSIIYYIEGYKNNRKCKWIMLNPTLARKAKTYHKDCLSVFEDLSKKNKPLN